MNWLVHNEKFVRAICMIAVYVSGVVFLIAMLAVGGMSVVSGILLTIFIVSLAILFALHKQGHRR